MLWGPFQDQGVDGRPAHFSYLGFLLLFDIALTKSWGHVWLHAAPITEKVQKIPETKIDPRRPSQLFNGSVSQQPIIQDAI